MATAKRDSKKSSAKKAPAKKAPAKKAPAKKASTKKASAKKAPAKKAASKKAPARKAPAKKAAPAKTTATAVIGSWSKPARAAAIAGASALAAVAGVAAVRAVRRRMAAAACTITGRSQVAKIVLTYLRGLGFPLAAEGSDFTSDIPTKASARKVWAGDLVSIVKERGCRVGDDFGPAQCADAKKVRDIIKSLWDSVKKANAI